MLDADELSDARADFAEAFFSDTATRTRTTWGSDGAGGQAVTGTATAQYLCRVGNPASEREGVAADRTAATAQWAIRLPYAADVRATDTLTVGDAIFEVVDTDVGRTQRLCLTAVCKRIT